MRIIQLSFVCDGLKIAKFDFLAFMVSLLAFNQSQSFCNSMLIRLSSDFNLLVSIQQICIMGKQVKKNPFRRVINILYTTGSEVPQDLILQVSWDLEAIFGVAVRSLQVALMKQFLKRKFLGYLHVKCIEFKQFAFYSHRSILPLIIQLK